MGKKDCINVAKELFNELGSWRDKSQKEFANIIDSHNTSIIKGISDLVAEVCRLQSKLSITTTEKNDLIEIAKNFSDEIRQLKSELAILRTLPEPEVTHHQVQDTCYVEDTDAQDQDEEGLGIGNETEEEELPLNYGNYLNETTCYEMPDEDANGTVYKEANEEDEFDWEEEEPLETIRSKKVDSSSNKTLQYHQKCNKEVSKFANTSADLICPECHLVFSTEENVKIHMKNVHSKSEDIISSRGYKLHKVIKNFKCELCPFKTNNRRNLNAHINGVHNENHVCIECGYTYGCKQNLKRHIDEVHEKIKGNNKFKCEKCPYTSGRKQRLKSHIEVVHEKIRRFLCGKCSYTATTKANLIYHIESVHNVGEKKFKCEKCPHASASKGNLKKHTESVHNGEEKKFKCNVCPYQCHLQQSLRRHSKNVHLQL